MMSDQDDVSRKFFLGDKKRVDSHVNKTLVLLVPTSMQGFPLTKFRPDG